MSEATPPQPCPLCGGAPTFKERPARHHRGRMRLTSWRLACWGEAQTAGPHTVEVGPFATKVECVERWNRRP